MQMDQNITTTREPGGILVATIDMPGRPMNVFSEALIDAVDRLVDQVAADPAITGVVITSAKSTFLVGADLEMVLGFTRAAATQSEAELNKLCGRLGRLFRRLEESPKPYVAAINGLALGGGLELTLGCHLRVVSDAPGVQLGLPEAKLGLLPGAGGTQRLPRLVGLERALPMLLRGDAVTAAEAVAIGLADLVAPADRLMATAIEQARSLGRPKVRWDQAGFTVDTAGIDLADPAILDVLARRAGLTAEDLRWNPACNAILKCLALGLGQDIVTAAEREMDCFVDLIRDPGCGNMVRTLFIDRRRAERSFNALGKLSVDRVVIRGEAPSAVLAALKSGRVEIVSEGAEVTLFGAGAKAASAAAGDIALLGSAGDSPSAHGCAVGVHVCADSSNGRAIEIVVERETPESENLAMALARKMRGTPLMTRGGRSVLADLAAARSGGDEQSRQAVIAAARRAVADGLVQDEGLLDVAAVTAGFIPAALGGPITAGRVQAA
jgi:3-hydroxyacyl-CoA dehydrogenase / enoyl-CoA hydratase / 3-hydroxybutyryl-CoA epimerase